MRRLLRLVSTCALVMFVVTSVSADNWVRGKVSAVTATSVTVMFKGKPMTFSIGKDTDFVGEGLGTASRKAGGLKLAEVLKVGDGVEVHYTGSGTAMQATEIRTGATGEGMSEAAGESASGQISALTGKSVTIKSGSGEMMFAIDPATRVIGRGAGTATQKAKATGKDLGIADLLKVGEDVVVSYRTDGSSRVANNIRVRR